MKTRISNLTAGYQQQEAELAKTEDYNEDNKKMADQLKDAFEKFKQTAEGWQSDDKKPWVFCLTQRGKVGVSLVA